MTDRGLDVSIQNRQEFLAAVLESVEDGIVACDAEGILTLFNRAAREFHGLTETPIPPDRWAEYYDLYLPDGRDADEQGGSAALPRAGRRDASRDVEMVIAPRRGPARTLLANGRALFGPDGEKLGAVVVMQRHHGGQARRRRLCGARAVSCRR